MPPWFREPWKLRVLPKDVTTLAGVADANGSITTRQSRTSRCATTATKGRTNRPPWSCKLRRVATLARIAFVFVSGLLNPSQGNPLRVACMT